MRAQGEGGASSAKRATREEAEPAEQDGAVRSAALVFAAAGPRPAAELLFNTVEVLCPGASQCQT